MDITRFSINRPIGIVIITLIVILVGSISLSRLPIDMMPDVTRPILSISTTYTNASPQEIEQLITRPVEEAMSSVQGVQEVTSVSMEGNSNVRVTFTWGVDLDAAANDIRDKLDRIIATLPDEASRPMLRKFDMASTPIITMGAYGNLDPIQMYNIIDNQIRYRLEKVPGVATLNIQGGLRREIHVDLYADKIKALNISTDQIVNRIKAENINLPVGSIEYGNLEMSIRNPGEYRDIEQLSNTVIIKKGTTPIKLKEIANVEDSFEEVRQLVRVNGKPGMRLAINKQSGTNTVEVAAKVLEEIKKINQEIPQLKIIPIIDTSNYIRQSINNLSSSVIYGGMLAVFVLLFFLRHLLSTVIISIAIPISIIATFILIYFGKFTLNMMSLGGLALGAGMLVDNSIVVLENIHRIRDESGYKAKEAALKGPEEVRGAIVASTLTVLVVFLPLIFVRGMSGVMFQQLAYVVSFSLVCSLGVAMTLVPMLASRVFKDSEAEDEKTSAFTDKLNVFFAVSHKALTGLENFYKKYLNLALNRRKRVIIAVFLILGSTLLLFPLVGSEFMPVTDENEVRVSIEMEPGTRIGIMDEKVKMIEAVVKKEVPEMVSMISSIGGSGYRASGTNTGDIRVSLKSRSMRKRSSEEVAKYLQRNLGNIPGVTVRCRVGEGFMQRQMGASNAERIQLEIRGYDLNVSEKLAPQLKELVEDVEGVTDVKINQEAGVREELFTIDRDKAADMHLSVSKIANALQTILSGSRAGYYREGGKEYQILVKFRDSKKMTVDEILNLAITNDEGNPVSLSNVLKVNEGKGYTQIERRNQERIFTLSANATDRPMGAVLKDITRKLKAIPVPRDFSIGFGGDYEQQQQSTRDLITSLVLSLVMIYMVMAFFYESLTDPFIVMFSVPLASIGVIIMLFLTNTTFNLQSYIGCIMLGGIVVNNAILLVDQANMLLAGGMSVMDSIKEAGRRRLRPILMTKLTAILGLLPLALGLAEGGEAEAPMARAVIGGLLSATLITLVLIPVIYSIVKKDKLKPDCSE